MRVVWFVATFLAVFRGCGDYTTHEATALSGTERVAMVAKLNHRLSLAKEPNGNVGVCLTASDLKAKKIGPALASLGFARSTNTWAFTKRGIDASQDCGNSTNYVGARYFVVGSMHVIDLMTSEAVPFELGSVQEVNYKTSISVIPSTPVGKSLAASASLVCDGTSGGPVGWSAATRSQAEFTVFTDDPTGDGTTYRSTCPAISH